MLLGQCSPWEGLEPKALFDIRARVRHLELSVGGVTLRWRTREVKELIVEEGVRGLGWLQESDDLQTSTAYGGQTS